MHRIITLLALIMSLAASSAPLQVSLLTCSEGGEIYELEGHTALRITHPAYGDFVVNWGVFDFNSPGFVYRFVKGETDYMAAAVPTGMFLDSYMHQGRTVREQVLNLDSIRSERLLALIIDNLKPENRVYRYNYVLDNCATRPLTLIERALGDTVTLGSTPLQGRDGSTFRNAMRHYHRNYPWYQFGIDTALGSGIDRRITARATSFAPIALADMMASSTLPDGEPLVISDSYIVGAADSPSVSAGPTPWYLTPMTWAIVTLLLALWASISQWHGHEGFARWYDTLFFTLCGVEGLILTFLIFVSVHEATSPNWLYLWLNPLCFIGAVAPWLKRWKRLEICYQSVNFALLITLIVIFIAGIQSLNPAFLPLIAASALRSIANILTVHRRK